MNIEPIVTICRKLKLYLKSLLKFNYAFALKIDNLKSIYKLQVQSKFEQLKF